MLLHEQLETMAMYSGEGRCLLSDSFAQALRSSWISYGPTLYRSILGVASVLLENGPVLRRTHRLHSPCSLHDCRMSNGIRTHNAGFSWDPECSSSGTYPEHAAETQVVLLHKILQATLQPVRNPRCVEPAKAAAAWFVTTTLWISCGAPATTFTSLPTAAVAPEARRRALLAQAPSASHHGTVADS